MTHKARTRSAVTIGMLLLSTWAAAGEPRPLPTFGDTLHPLAGTSLNVSACTESRFVCDFEAGAASSSGPDVQPLVAKGRPIDGLVGKAFAVESLAYPGAALINPESTYFGFWLRLDFDPATDTERRVLMQMGDGEHRSLVMRTNGAGKLMLILSDDDYASACRADISTWERGEWHHVAGWFHRAGHRLWLMIDGYGVDSTIMYHNDGLMPGDLGPLYIGCGPDGGGYCAVDEIVFSNADGGQVARAHRDWLLGIAQLAARDRIKTQIKPSAWGIASNPKAVVGTIRTFGLECTVPRVPRITDRGLTSDPDRASSAPVWTVFNLQDHNGSSVGHEYGIGERSAWSSSDPAIANVLLVKNERTGEMVPAASGRFEIKKAGNCTITAKMGGRKWTYDLEVIERDRPDLLVQYITRLPRYDNNAVKTVPAPGDEVTFEVHIANRGFAKSKPVYVFFAAAPVHSPELGGDPAADREMPTPRYEKLPVLDVHETATLTFKWKWRAQPCEIVASIGTNQPEISTHNNERSFVTVRSRDVYLLVDPKSWAIWHDVNDNHTGTFALEDWLDAQREAWDRLLRESVYPATSPYGVQVRLHLDALIEMQNDPNDWGANDPGPYWYGGWLCNQGWTSFEWASGVHYSLMHEWGHGAFAGSDLYSLSIWEPWFHVRDDDGNKVAGTGAFPISDMWWWANRQFLFNSSADDPRGVNGRFYCATMMNGCGPQLHEGFAGHIQHNHDLRRQDLWQIHRRSVPLVQNTLVVLDIEGNPVAGAELAVYQQSYGVEQNSGRSLWPNCIKFAGRTDAEGKWIYPYETAVSFDEPATDVVERSVELASPLSTPKYPWPASPGVWSNNSMQLVGVRKGPWTEYHVLDSFQFAAEAYRNDRLSGTYVIQTNLPASPGDVETKPFTVEPAQDPNKVPVVVVADVVRVAPGAEAEVDASASYDPEGKPVSVHWILAGWRQEFDIRQLGGKVDSDQGPVLKFTAPDKPCEIKARVYCCDTVRLSEVKEVTILVEDQATTPDGNDATGTDPGEAED